MFGVNKPRALSIEPSVPPRIGSRHGRIRIEELLHVAIALLHGHSHVRARLFCRDLVRELAKELLVLLELLGVEVARDEAQLGLGGRARDPRRMNEALASRSEEHT